MHRALHAEAACYAGCARFKVVSDFERPSRAKVGNSPTELMKLAWKSKWYTEYRGGPPHEVGPPDAGMEGRTVLLAAHSTQVPPSPAERELRAAPKVQRKRQPRAALTQRPHVR